MKASKYFAVILDCATCVSKTEKLSLTVKYVFDGSTVPVRMYEHFIDFIEVKESTGKSLPRVLLEKLETLHLNLHDTRCQGYDNVTYT